MRGNLFRQARFPSLDVRSASVTLPTFLGTSMDDTSVTRWIEQLKDGESEAAQRIWEAYFSRMVRLARRRLADAPRRAVDEEDIALSAFKSFCLGLEQGRFPRLADRHDLWSLLVAITAHKAVDALRHERRQKRGGGRVTSGSDTPPAFDFGQVISKNPSPEFAAQVADEFERLLAQLDDETLRNVALWKLEGCSVEDIAARLDCATRTVKRKLQRIRTIWSAEFPSQPGSVAAPAKETQ